MNKWTREKVEVPAAPAATTSWVRGRRTKEDVYLSAEEFRSVTQAFRELQKNSPFLADLIAQGLDRKQIAARLRWSLQSLNFVLANYAINVDRTNLNRRLFRAP